jgi:UDPglucose 6-dehydrogenase
VNVAVMGTGHVGLITCVALARIGHDVIGTDIDAERIGQLQRSVPPFYEPELESSLAAEMSSRRLRFTSEASDALAEAHVVFICVGTPARADGHANLLAMERSATEIGRHAADGAVVVEKSTVPAGTAERLELTLQRESGGRPFEVASNPEFLREGSALKDALEPDRIVVGAGSDRAFRVMRELYAPLTSNGCPLIETDIATAELAKHASNAFLALKISFANALARICEVAGADVTSVADVMGSDPRIGRAFLNAGLGYGGYCFPKDVAALERLAESLGYPFPMLTEVARVNDEAVDAAVRKVHEAVWNLEEKRIALLGLSFKPGTDDVRFSPALDLARRLIAAGADVAGYDPSGARTAKDDLPALEVVGDAYEAASGAHCLVLATEWEEFATLDLATLRNVMAYPVIVDARNALDADAIVAAGFTYYAMGRPSPANRRTVASATGASGRADYNGAAAARSSPSDR